MLEWTYEEKAFVDGRHCIWGEDRCLCAGVAEGFDGLKQLMAGEGLDELTGGGGHIG